MVAQLDSVVKLKLRIDSLIFLMTISNRVLQAFLVLAEVRKFTVAAERCHMSQSALSQLIARLEDRVGVRLFERGTRLTGVEIFKEKSAR